MTAKLSSMRIAPKLKLYMNFGEIIGTGILPFLNHKKSMHTRADLLLNCMKRHRNDETISWMRDIVSSRYGNMIIKLHHSGIRGRPSIFVAVYLLAQFLDLGHRFGREFLPIDLDPTLRTGQLWKLTPLVTENRFEHRNRVFLQP